MNYKYTEYATLQYGFCTFFHAFGFTNREKHNI